MKLRTFSLLLLSLTVALPACGGKTITKKAKTDVIQGVGAETTPVEARIFADPGPTETLYLAHLRDSQDRPISGALVAVLVQKPEGMEMRQPRRKTVAAETISGRDGIAPILVESDGFLAGHVCMGNKAVGVVEGHGVILFPIQDLPDIYITLRAPLGVS